MHKYLGQVSEVASNKFRKYVVSTLEITNMDKDKEYLKLEIV